MLPISRQNRKHYRIYSRLHAGQNRRALQDRTVKYYRTEQQSTCRTEQKSVTGQNSKVLQDRTVEYMQDRTEKCYRTEQYSTYRTEQYNACRTEQGSLRVKTTVWLSRLSCHCGGAPLLLLKQTQKKMAQRSGKRRLKIFAR